MTRRVLKFCAGILITLAAMAASAAFVLGIAFALAYSNLPDISELLNYYPKQPLRVYSADGDLIGEFGEERRSMVPVNDIPKVMRDAVVAIEDARFYQHGGVDYIGVLRAALANLRRVKSQGASTITMQVARNAYLSPEKSYTRKLYEMLLTYKLEQQLTKDQILEIYMNQIYLGNRSYGFAAAAETYFGKPLQDISLAEAAMLAGLPQAPSANNPISNLPRARIRQHYILDRMAAHHFITQAEADEAKKEPLNIRPPVKPTTIPAEYAAEMARQLIYAQYGDETYTRGLNVYTTIQSREQSTAYTAISYRWILAFDWPAARTVMVSPSLTPTHRAGQEKAGEASKHNSRVWQITFMAALCPWMDTLSKQPRPASRKFYPARSFAGILGRADSVHARGPGCPHPYKSAGRRGRTD